MTGAVRYTHEVSHHRYSYTTCAGVVCISTRYTDTWGVCCAVVGGVRWPAPRTLGDVTTLPLPPEEMRFVALQSAVAAHTTGTSESAILRTADLFLWWLRAGGTLTSLRLVVGAAQSEDDDSTPSQKGPADMAGMNTGQKIQLTADPEDAAGYDVDVPVVFTVADDTVASIVDIPEDPKSVWVVSGAPGSTVVTATVTKLDGTELTGTLAVDVVPGDVAVVNIVAGDPVDE